MTPWHHAVDPNHWRLRTQNRDWYKAGLALDKELSLALDYIDRALADLHRGAPASSGCDRGSAKTIAHAAWVRVEAEMRAYAHLGATDTEPRWVLADALTRHLRRVHRLRLVVDGNGGVTE